MLQTRGCLLAVAFGGRRGTSCKGLRAFCCPENLFGPNSVNVERAHTPVRVLCGLSCVRLRFVHFVGSRVSPFYV